MTRGTESTYQRLKDEADAVRVFMRRLSMARRNRDLLIVKLVTSGESTRNIGKAAGVSSPGVSWIARRRTPSPAPPETQP